MEKRSISYKVKKTNGNNRANKFHKAWFTFNEML